MNFIKNKSFKQFILVLVLLILFNFICPHGLYAGAMMDNVKEATLKIPLYIESGVVAFLNNIFVDDDKKTSSQTDLMVVYLTPENIIKGKFLLFNANIFENISNNNNYYDYNKIVGGKNELRNVIAGWYYALRNFAIVALLSVLVYVGIRMIMSTIAQDKSKYRAMFKDWLVALCLLFTMHYIMIAVFNLTSKVTEALGRRTEYRFLYKLH